jgi:hypothetical protein
MRTAISLSIVLLAALVALSSTSAQIACSSGPGGLTACYGPDNQNTIQLDLGSGGGVIIDSRGEMTPYVVMPSQPRTSERPYSYESQRPSGRSSSNYGAPDYGAPSAPVFTPYSFGNSGK